MPDASVHACAAARTLGLLAAACFRALGSAIRAAAMSLARMSLRAAVVALVAFAWAVGIGGMVSMARLESFRAERKRFRVAYHAGAAALLACAAVLPACVLPDSEIWADMASARPGALAAAVAYGVLSSMFSAVSGIAASLAVEMSASSARAIEAIYRDSLRRCGPPDAN